MTRELTEMLRKNRTIDWQHKESARAGMRKLVKRLLKKYHYPPEQAEYALDIVLKQCEEWTDDEDYAVAGDGVVKMYTMYDDGYHAAADKPE